jgi:predicted dehydrogenase
MLADAAPGEEEEMLNMEQMYASGSGDPLSVGYARHCRAIEDLIQAIEGKRTPAVPGREARKAVEIILAIYRSVQTETPVSLPLVSSAESADKCGVS